jgi:phage shock protein E
MLKHVWIFIFVINNSFAQEKNHRDLSVQEFKSKLDSVTGKVLIDLRTPDEIAKGVIPDAIQLDYFRKDFEAQIAKLDKTKTYFLYCAAGGRSAETAELMSKLGFKQVYNLKDGFNGWKKQKMPIIPLK